MAFVIPNDSRNKSAVMRSHWGFYLFIFFPSLKSPFTASYDQPVPETQTGSWVEAPEIDSFLLEDLPAAQSDALFF